MNRTELLLTGAAIGLGVAVVGIGVYQVIRAALAGASDDEPIIMAGGSLYIIAAATDLRHSYGFAKDDIDPNSLAYQKDHSKAKEDKNAKIQVEYSNNGNLAYTQLISSGQVTLGYCTTAQNCMYPHAEEKETLQIQSASGMQSITISSRNDDGSTTNDMSGVGSTDGLIWSHNPPGNLYWVSVGGTTGGTPYTCTPGQTECVVAVHFCKYSCP